MCVYVPERVCVLCVCVYVWVFVSECACVSECVYLSKVCLCV